MLAVVAAYPSEDVVKSDEKPVAVNEGLSSEEEDLNGAESRYGGFGGFGFGRGL